MSFYIRIISSADGRDIGDYAGGYVRHYTPATMLADGTYKDDGYLELSKHASRARRFASRLEAFEYYRRENGTRPDGKLNRPLTSYTVEIAELQECGARAS